MDPLVFHYDPKPTLWDQICESAGVTTGYVVMRNAETGPARVAKVAMLSDGEGGGSVERVGEFEDCWVYDDSAE